MWARLHYKRCQELMKQARSKRLGKRINYRVRLFEAGENFEVRVDDKRIAWIRPDNVAVLFFSGVDIKGSYWKDYFGVKVLPHPYKHRKLAVIPYEAWYEYRGRYCVDKYAVPAVDGLEFDLCYKEFLNPTPWPERVQTDKAGPWRSKVRKFKQNLKVMSMMGAFNQFPSMVWSKDESQWQNYNPIFPEELYYFIVNEDYHQMVIRFLQSVKHHYSRQLIANGHLDMTEWPVRQFNSMYNILRDPVRKLAGCYIEEVPHGLDDAETGAA